MLIFQVKDIGKLIAVLFDKDFQYYIAHWNFLMTSALELDITTKLLASTFQKNLVTLSQYMPEIARTFNNYKAQEIFLAIDDNSHVNLSKNGNIIYENNPKQDILAQVKEFKNKPRHFFYRANINNGNDFVEDECFLQVHHLAAIRSIRRQDTAFTEPKPGLPTLVPCLILVGIGLGYHLEALVNEHDIRHTIIYEPEPDIFYSFLHVVDLEPIFKKCTKDLRSITFKVGDSPGGFVNHISRFLWEKGHFIGCRMYFYRHYRSEIVDEASQLLHNLISRSLHGWGFFEDELISVAHTLLNFEKCYPIIKKPEYIKTHPEHPPVIIVGNGPSLDSNLEHIKEHAQDCIIVSSGSALRVLHDSGICPDYHIEIERTRSVDAWFVDLKDDDYFKKITLIALNTVHPDVLARFKRVLIGMKPNDAGSLLTLATLDEKLPEYILHCNPTAVNGSIALMLALGFTELYLFGVDMGFLDPDYHHSKKSAYYQSDDDFFKIGTPKSNRSMEGNFKEEVLTNDNFDFSRFEIERSLHNYPNVRCYNCSDGVKIKYTDPLPAKQINIIQGEQIKQDWWGKNEKNYLWETDFSLSETVERSFFRNFSVMQDFIVKIISSLTPTPNSIGELLDLFTTQKAALNLHKNEFETIYCMCAGTLNYLQTTTLTYALDYQDENKALAFVEKSFVVWKQYLNNILRITSDHYKSPHDTYIPGHYMPKQEPKEK